LAASSGLTIPLQITLSEIKLSAFIILVFSRQKGLTLVFRNDPLESLKVSSTFDSIPFVREYLQKEIEMQLRVLMMEELPAIIHRLSLRLWCPDYGTKEEEEFAKSTDKLKEKGVAVDPFGSPPQDAVDAHGNVLDASEISTLTLEGGSEPHSLFSQKNLLRLAALNDSQRTLSLFTPSIREAVFRAWASPTERSDNSSPATPSLIRSQSAYSSTGTTYTFSDHGAETGSMSSRPSLVNLHSQSATTGLSLGSGRHSRSHHRKKKNRVVNLRKSKTTDDVTSESGDSESMSATSSVVGGSEPAFPTRIIEEPEEELVTPPRSPTRVRFRSREDSIDLGETPRQSRLFSVRDVQADVHLATGSGTQAALMNAIEAPVESADVVFQEPAQVLPVKRPIYHRTPSWTFPQEKSSNAASNSSAPFHYTSAPSEASSGGIVEQAWMMKMAGELARRAHEQKANMARREWDSRTAREETPPPAYEVQ
jgi:distribution and morphology protein 34